ncbi:MAG: glycosyltransferase family 1 protein [Gammaproteobacteria bacterium]|nr:MAG: glycosyltransferase family 1 protein [Gammaproteobacteria bacterium]
MKLAAREWQSPKSSSLRILFIQYSSNPSGSTISGLLTVKGFLENDWKVDVAFGFEGPYLQEYEEIGCSVHVVEHRNWLRGKGIRIVRNIWDEVQASRRFEKLIRRLKPSVVYVNTLVSFAGVIAAHNMGVPSIWHVRELFDDMGGEMHRPMIGGKALVRQVLRRLPTQIIAVSQVVADNVVGSSTKVKVQVIPNAVSRALLAEALPQSIARESLGLRTAAKIIGVPGGLRPVKGHDFFLEAATIVANQNPDCEFVISGSGTSAYRDYLERQVNRLGLSDKVVFTGRMETMNVFYSACDVICIPSKSESFGRTAIEAMAMGIPVIGSRVGGLKEIIDDGKNGLLVNYGDVASLASAMDRLLKDTSLRRSLGIEGQRKVELEYSESVYQQRIIDVVNGVLANTRKN